MPGLSGSSPSYLDKLATNWQETPALASPAQATFRPAV
jgi:hypothetical protein